MIPIIGYNEDLAEFPDQSVDMRPACTPAIRQRLAALFGARSVTYLGRGFNNAHHRLSGISGSPDVVVRRVLAPVPALAKRLDREYHVLEYLADLDYPHAPRPVRTIAPEEIDGSPAFAMTFVEGTNTGLSADLASAMGRAVRRLHSLPVPDWLATSGSTTEPLPILLTMVKNWKRIFASVRPGMADRHARRLERLIPVLPERVQALDWSGWWPAVLHGDLGDHNYLWEPARADPVLLDWEFASVSDPVLDLMWLFNRRGFDAGCRASFFDGYGQDVPPVWHEQLPVLQAMCAVEDALWAQSGVNDIQAGRNRHYFKEGELNYLRGEVARIEDIEL